MSQGAGLKRYRPEFRPRVNIPPVDMRIPRNFSHGTGEVEFVGCTSRELAAVTDADALCHELEHGSLCPGAVPSGSGSGSPALPDGRQGHASARRTPVRELTAEEIAAETRRMERQRDRQVFRAEFPFQVTAVSKTRRWLLPDLRPLGRRARDLERAEAIFNTTFPFQVVRP